MTTMVEGVGPFSVIPPPVTQINQSELAQILQLACSAILGNASQRAALRRELPERCRSRLPPIARTQTSSLITTKANTSPRMPQSVAAACSVMRMAVAMRPRRRCAWRVVGDVALSLDSRDGPARRKGNSTTPAMFATSLPAKGAVSVHEFFNE